MAKHDLTAISKGRPRITIILSCILILTAGALAFAARNIAGFGEWYAATIYPLIVSTLGRAAGAVPLSVSEMICCMLPLLLIADIIICRKRLRRVVLHLIVLASLLFFMYEANCGVNYYRRPFVPSEVYEDAVFEVSELTDYCEYIISQLEQEELDDAVYPEWKELSGKASSAIEGLAADHPGLRGFYPVPKELTVMSGIFSAMGVSGIYSPFAAEANVNGQMPDMEKPFTACHELSHLRGYMNEGEANYIGWLACIGSDEPEFRRSGWLIAWSYAGAQLRRADPEKFAELSVKLPERAVMELEENYEFWTSHETKASEVQNKVNDAYLKSNGVGEGVSSYGRLTTLMLLWYRDNKDSIH